MHAPPGTTPLLRGALVTIDSDNKQSTIVFQYNPATLRRSLQSNTVGGNDGDRSQAVRFSGAASEVFQLKAQFDATDALAAGDAVAAKDGIYPQLAALALLVYPSTAQVAKEQQMVTQGDIEVIPLLAPRTLFVWGPKRVLPVKVEAFSILEQFYDARLNPIRATVDLGLRVLTYTDVAPSNPDYDLFIVYQQGLERLAQNAFSQDAGTITGVDPSHL